MNVSIHRRCECGCGSPVRRRYISGHNGRGSDNGRWKGDAATYSTLHAWLARVYPKRGRCESCGEEGRTEYAFLNHPAPHTRNRKDYSELCIPCHRRRDMAGKVHWRSTITHCKRGHEFTPENTYVIPSSGSRRCRTCWRIAYEERKAVA